MIIIIIKALSQLCWGRLHKSCFSIPIYLEQNLQLNCNSSDIFLISHCTSSLSYPFPFVGHLPSYSNFCWLSTFISKLFLTGVVAGLHWTCLNHLKWILLILSLVNAISKCSRNLSFIILSYLVLPYIYLNILIYAIPKCGYVAS